jgi:hypothetical protein
MVQKMLSINKSTIERLKFYFSVFFFAILIFMSIFFMAYKSIVKGMSKELYTIATIVDIYSTSKDYGRTYEYVVNDVKYMGHCTTDDCAKLKIGEKYLVKFWSKRHNWSYLLTDNHINTKLETPSGGWETPP